MQTLGMGKYALCGQLITQAQNLVKFTKGSEKIKLFTFVITSNMC
jgi:hypothetical protein